MTGVEPHKGWGGGGGLSVVSIEDIAHLSEGYYRLTFSRSDNPLPGQFYMVLVPGVDEFPLGIALIKGVKRGLIVKVVGEGTRALCEMQPGDKIGIRGPYGRGYSMERILSIGRNQGPIVLVGGGSGIASILGLGSYAPLQGVPMDMYLGFRTRAEVIDLDKIWVDGNNINVHYATDDGSFGHKGFVTDMVEERAPKGGYIAACGPEPMMFKLYSLSLEHGTFFEASLERYMKCGIGICDSCSINGYKVCRDGPVFDHNDLANMPDFGVYRRDECGRKVRL